jgi:hypothetical protein
MSHLDNQRRLLSLAAQLESDAALSEDQRRLLASALHRIGAGEDANEVLGVSLKRGQKLSDAIAKQRMSLILHWVAGAVQPDPESGGKSMSIEAACELAVETIVPVAKAAFPGADNRRYDVDYIMRCWSEPAYAHMRSPYRGWFDSDYPYRAGPPRAQDPR